MSCFREFEFWINGIDYNLLFDTGAPMCLTPKILTAVNADKVQNDQVKDVNGNNTSSPTVIIKDIHLGNLNFRVYQRLSEFPTFLNAGMLTVL